MKKQGKIKKYPDGDPDLLWYEAIKYIPKVKKRPDAYKIDGKIVQKVIVALINSIELMKHNNDDNY